MSRNMRAVRVEWGAFASLLIGPEQFENVVTELLGGDDDGYSYDWNDADEVFKLWLKDGKRFLDRVRDCQADELFAAWEDPERPDGLCCLQNLKALESEWRPFIDDDGHLEIWVDGY